MSHPYSSIPEISFAASDSGVVRIPVEQDVPFTHRVRAVVDSAEFQRLAQITQLALTSRVYPGATHTRFEHALGVYHNAIRYLWQLGKDERFAATVSTHDAEVLVVAALLHDIGHWPFCHPIEDMALPEMPPHETFAAQFLQPENELTQVLERDWGVSADEILNVLAGESTDDSFRLRQSILSGPIDIDKMDYLLRDSQHCGVPYGKNFDRNRLVSSLMVNEAGDGLAISAKGKTAAEMMVFARYVMFSEVYWHHTVRSATTMFARAFFEQCDQFDLSQMFSLTEPQMIQQLVHAAAGTDSEQLTAGLFGSKRRLHKRLAEFSVFQNAELYFALRKLGYPDLVACSNRLAEAINACTETTVHPLDVLIDAPPVHREVEFKIDVYFSDERVYRPLAQVSPIVEAMSRTQFDDCVKRVRIFAAPHVHTAIHNIENIADLIQEVVLKEASCPATSRS